MTLATKPHHDGRCDRNNGIVSLRSAHGVDQTVDQITGLLSAKRVKLFATIDHAAEARAAGLAMRPTVVLVFGSPQAGTPLMLAAPSIALDLPLKVLVSEDADGATWISYLAPSCLADRHDLPLESAAPLNAVEAIAEAGASA
jgi:uncharacterized protein (DUF302 family)